MKWAQVLRQSSGANLCGPCLDCGIVCVYSFHALERPKVRAARRALFLPHKEGAGGGVKRGVAKSLCIRSRFVH